MKIENRSKIMKKILLFLYSSANTLLLWYNINIGNKGIGMVLVPKTLVMLPKSRR
jgi:hypothetical protein